jgi:Ca-activated chloride channel family protein
VPTTTSGTRGVSQGGAQDIARFREVVAQGQIPSPDTLEATGFFAEHAFDLPPATCGRVVCLNPSLAVAPRFDNSNWTMGFVTLSTAVDPATLPRPPLHLVVAVTTADRSFGYGRGLAALVGELRPEDRVSVVVARSTSSLPTIALHGVPPNDPRLAMLGTPYDSGAVYESLTEASAAIETLSGFSGVSRILLVTSGPRSPWSQSRERAVGLGEALARRGVGVSVIGVGASYRADVPAAIGSLGAGTYSYAQNDTDLEQVMRSEGATRLHPLVTDFRMRIQAAPGYRIGRIYGARRAKFAAGVVEVDSPALFIASRRGSNDVGGGRRGGGSGVFVELIPTATPGAAIDANAPALRVVAAWRNPAAMNAMEMTSAEVINPLRPGQNPEGMWPTFTDDTRAKVFMMLNMYLALRGAVSFYDSGDCARAQGVIDMMQNSYDGWQRRRPDPDIEADGRLMESLRNNLTTRCQAVSPVQPRDSRAFGGGCFFI